MMMMVEKLVDDEEGSPMSAVVMEILVVLLYD